VLSRIFHIAINSKDLDRSVAFYQRLGFQIVQDRTVQNPAVREAFAVPSADLRFIHLRLGDDAGAVLLDIVEWRDPGTADGHGTPAQNQQGLTRFAVLTDDTEATYRTLVDAGSQFLTKPTTVMTPEGGWKGALAVDPDGVVVQITELLAPQAT
jgi:catechol 2,3-dioxygenase-like lactoylglutathione lyase family enzyme